MENISSYIIPVIFLLIILVALAKKVPSFDAFLEGAKQGFVSTYKIAPSLLGLVVGVNMLISSGFLDIISTVLSPMLDSIGFPKELLPIALLRPFSGSGTIAMLDNIIKEYGANSFIATSACVMAGSSETTFYAVTVYYGSIGIKKIRYTVPCALIADAVCAVMAVFTTRFFIFT